ncbi:hypothetical protein [Bartonella sp. HY406]|uniref:hypothetical protein n=1 Tax=Bartonella sp. HY406 TaxID=2979331 RepID=UPI0021C8F3E5|nr:hypothetical protein [Bartonella sp. HY406]UXN03404.1 hypothetical protein N6B01_13325 [Bartonella sp. HY406]
MIRLLVVLFVLLSLSSQSKATEITMPFGPNIEKLVLPDDWTFEIIPYAKRANLYYLSNGQSTIRIFDHDNSDRDDKLLLCKPSIDLYKLSPCAENTFQYKNLLSYSELRYDCHDESCNNLIKIIKNNYIEKKSFTFDGKTFAIGEKWHPFTRTKFGLIEVYGFSFEDQIEQSIMIIRRKATKSDNIARLLNNIGFYDFAKNEFVAEQIAQNEYNFYALWPQPNKMLMNIDIDENFNFYVAHINQENLVGIEDLFNFLSQKFENHKTLDRPETIIAQKNMRVEISDGYNFKYIYGLGFCNQYKTFDDYVAFIKSNSHLDWAKADYQGNEAIKAEYTYSKSTKTTKFYKMCIDGKTKTVINFFQQQENQQAYDAIDNKLTQGLK